MRRRSTAATVASSPTMVGAVTVLISIVAVVLAYNANNGLPFVPVYRVSVDVPNAARIGPNNEVRVGGARIGVVESITPVEDPAAPAEDAGELGRVAARLNLKLDLAAQPLPQDSVFRIRYRSTFGLKYLEIIRGTGEPAPEGHVFIGTDDGAICRLPRARESFADKLTASAGNGCFQGQTEFDEVNDTFDARTRRAQRENLVGYGSGLAGRGVSLNDTISELPRLFRGLGPVARVLADPDVDLRRFVNGLARTARYTAPAALDQALGFAFAARAFRAISADEELFAEAIAEAPLTYETGIRLLPSQRAFLARVETFARLMRPGARDLRVTLPVLNDALEQGAPVLRRSPPVNRRLRAALRELDQLVAQPTTRLTLTRLGETFTMARPLARYVVPAQTVCNYFNYWFTFLPGGLSERDHVGHSLRQALVRFPAAPAAAEVSLSGYAGIAPNGKAGPPDYEFRPYEIPISNSHPYLPTGQRNADCQAGQIGYPLGQALVPGQTINDPGNRLSDYPGSRGPTTLFYDAEGNKTLFDSRVASRQPRSWRGIGR